MKTIKILSMLIFAALLLASCDKEEDEEGDNMSTSGNLTLDIDGLADLGSDFVYEGWIMIDGSPVTTGTFSVDANGDLSTKSFNLTSDQVTNAKAFILTIEPMPDNDPAPSMVHIIAGDISSNKAMLTVSHSAALGTDFSTSSGSYFMATPTNSDATDEKSGVWFLDPTSGTPVSSLDLPTLPDGWQYEGWAVIDGTPVTTGKFTDPNAADLSSPFSGTMAGPMFPGEDFLMNAPTGLTFPTDLSGGKIVISVEPMPDNSDAPFLLKPLFGEVAAHAMEHTVYMLDNISANNNPTGSANLSIQ